ncbi:Fic family protein [Candidatus Woesearchaeota archaeon]|nr:Fic family protein [Candidatus Woesearchaeota archaeon]
MIIEIRQQGKKKKYYLSHSFRDENKVKKIRRYLGSDLTKEEIEKLRQRAEELIIAQIATYKKLRDPLRYELSDKELNFIKKLEPKKIIQINHLSKDQWKRFTELFTYNTNAIEGSEVNEKEVKEILEENKWPKEVKKEDISETYGVAEAVDYIRKTKEHLSINLIRKLHEITFKNSKHFAGKLRPSSVEVVIRDGAGNVVHSCAPSNRIESLLKELIEWYNKHKNKYHPILLAAVVHNQFENIHPFQDGNGRVGRLLLNNILIKHNLPPVNVGFNNRIEYYKSLQEYQNKGNVRSTLDLILKEYKILKKELGDYKRKKM